MADVAIIAGSRSDRPIAEQAIAVLEAAGVPFEYEVISAHREPDRLDTYLGGCACRVFIAIAGLSAALPGVIASKTDRPVIGVPVSGTLQGLDALLAIVQMPKGVPVACVGIDNGENAGRLALRILAAGKKD
jgi:5-(carboxyamino)imidazole ribonucleotide mutase